MIDAPFKPATTSALVRDILETYHWEEWTTERIAIEAARIRRTDVTDGLIATVGSAVRRLAAAGRVRVGSKTMVHYYEGGSQVAVSRTFRWEDVAC